MKKEEDEGNSYLFGFEKKLKSKHEVFSFILF
jgi:hypothetical protein